MSSINRPKVAIIIPTMNRPDFILRQLHFYELMDNPHPIYISDSSNKDNAKKIKEEIKKFKKFPIIYQWSAPGRDHLLELLNLVKEKYCIQMGDDDLLIPKTISECADFLEKHPDYGTCGGKQVNFRFSKEDYDKPFGIIKRLTRPFGRSFEEGSLLLRVKDFWSDSSFICFSVRRLETEKKIRNITKNFSLMDYVTEFILWSILIFSGKSKIIDKLGYIMQVSDNRHPFVDYAGVDHFMASPINEKWGIILNGLSEFTQEFHNLSKEEGDRIAKWAFTLYLINQFKLNAIALFPLGQKPSLSGKESLFKKIKNILSRSRYSNDIKAVRDFLEQKTP